MNERLEQIEKELEELKREYEHPLTPRTEVYTRIVGYHRDVSSWNKGKAEEYKDRSTFPAPTQAALDARNNRGKGKAASYIIFTTERCPKCPTVKRFMENIDLEGVEGSLDDAIKFNVQTVPTVIFLGSEGQEIARFFDVDSIKKYLK